MKLWPLSPFKIKGSKYHREVWKVKDTRETTGTRERKATLVADCGCKSFLLEIFFHEKGILPKCRHPFPELLLLLAKILTFYLQIKIHQNILDYPFKVCRVGEIKRY